MEGSFTFQSGRSRPIENRRVPARVGSKLRREPGVFDNRTRLLQEKDGVW
jgi:hypothetical protein